MRTKVPEPQRREARGVHLGSCERARVPDAQTSTIFYLLSDCENFKTDAVVGRVVGACEHFSGSQIIVDYGQRAKAHRASTLVCATAL